MKNFTFLLVTLFAMSLTAQVELTSALHEYESDGVWINASNEIYVYDSNRNLSSKNTQMWDDTNSNWRNSELFLCTYNSNNLLSEEVLRVWDSNLAIPGYVDNVRIVYTYNSMHKLTQYNYYFWVNGNWENSSKFIFSFDANGKKIETIFYNWDQNNWVLVNRIIISYDENGKASSQEEEVYTGTAWVKSTIRNYTYNEDNKVILESYKSWVTTGYVDYYKYEYAYDVNGNLINKKFYYNENGTFVLNSDETNTFDTSLLMASFTHPFMDSSGLEYEFLEFPYVNKLISNSYSNQRITYNYGEATANVNSFDSANIIVYPNPTKSIINLDVSELEKVDVYSVLGLKLFSTEKKEIDLTNYYNGIYLFKIYTQKGKVANKKVVKN